MHKIARIRRNAEIQKRSRVFIDNAVVFYKVIQKLAGAAFIGGDYIEHSKTVIGAMMVDVKGDFAFFEFLKIFSQP